MIFSILLSISAMAATEVSFNFSRESSVEWVKAFYQIDDETATCQITALRPDGKEEALYSKQNKLICKTSTNPKGLVQNFSDALVDSWGGRQTISFEIKGGKLMDAMIDTFKKKSRGSHDSPQEGDMWSRISLCDPLGSFCTQAIFLNESGSVNSAAQAECKIETDLIAPATTTPNPSDFDPSYSGGLDYIDALVDAQTKAGVRVISNRRCLFMAP